MLRVEENYVAGIPCTAVAGFAPTGLVQHWTAGAKGRAGANSTIAHFIATRYTVNASYHILYWVEHAATHGPGCITYAMWIVPATKASHSMNPAQAFVPKRNTTREKARFAEVRRILNRDTDPNADVWALSYCGMPADLAADLKCAEFEKDLQNLNKQLIAHPSNIIARPHFGHGWIQPSTRYEMDNTTEGTDLLIAKLYGEAPAPVPAPTPTTGADMKFTNPIVTQDWDVVVGTASTFTRPDGSSGYFTAKERVRSIAEGTVNGVNSRLLDYGPNHEALTIKRTGLTNPGPRIVGSPTATGITQAKLDADVAAAKAAGIKAGKKTAATTIKAVVTTEAAKYGA